MTERHLQVSKGFIRRADDNTSDIKTLNRSIFIPAITFDKSKKRAAQEAKLAQRYEEERAEREATNNNIKDTHERIANGLRGSGRDGPPGWDEEDDGESLQKGTAQYAAKKAQWSKYQTQDDDSDDDRLEEELSKNLDQMSLGIARIKEQALLQGDVVKRQNEQLKKLHSTVDDVDQRLVSSTDRVSLFLLFVGSVLICRFRCVGSRAFGSSVSLTDNYLLPV
jgi:protein transport protein SEC9